MDDIISKLTTPEECEQFAVNVAAAVAQDGQGLREGALSNLGLLNTAEQLGWSTKRFKQSMPMNESSTRSTARTSELRELGR